MDFNPWDRLAHYCHPRNFPSSLELHPGDIAPHLIQETLLSRHPLGSAFAGDREVKQLHQFFATFQFILGHAYNLAIAHHMFREGRHHGNHIGVRKWSQLGEFVSIPQNPGIVILLGQGLRFARMHRDHVCYQVDLLLGEASFCQILANPVGS